jgi:hypothetical protein
MPPVPPVEIGTLVIALRTRMPRSAAPRWLLIAAIAGLMVAALAALFEVRIAGTHIDLMAALLALALSLLSSLLTRLDRAPVPAWVGDAGVAVARGRLGSPALVVRFSDVDTLDRMVTGPVITLVARSASGRVLAWFRAACAYRPGGPTDPDDPETFRHLPSTHAWWLITAAAQAWRGSRAASRVSSPP